MEREDESGKSREGRLNMFKTCIKFSKSPKDLKWIERQEHMNRSCATIILIKKKKETIPMVCERLEGKKQMYWGKC